MKYILFLVAVSVIFYYSGNILWIGPVFYLYLHFYASITANLLTNIAITLLSFLFCSLIVILEYIKIIPPAGLIESISTVHIYHQNIVTSIAILAIQFFFIYFAGIEFAKKLIKKDSELLSVKSELKKWNGILENRVRSRTQELQKSKTQLASLYRVSRTISSTLNLDDILQTILDFSIKISKAKRGSIMLLDMDKHIFFIKIPYNKQEKNLDRIIFEEDKNTIGWVVKNKRYLYIEDLENHEVFTKIKLIDRKITKLLIMPIIIENRVKGVINLENTNISSELINLLKSFSDGAAVAIHNAQLYEQIQESYFEIIKALAQAIEAKDPYTHGHSIRVMHYADLLAQKMNLPEKERENLKFAAVLHDIGKIGIGETVLNNRNKLSSDEYQQMKQHPVIGQNIIQPIELLKPIQLYIRHHHEWYNGNGYPDGLSGEKIPYSARILSIADAYDAMKSDRPYRHSLSEEKAIMELKKGSGTQFDPEIVQTFIQLVEKTPDLIKDSLK